MPPQNRDHSQMDACSDYLEQQIQAINPKVIVTLGRYSMARFLPDSKISDVHGQALQVRGRLVIPMFHPAAALHQPSLRPIVEKDFSRLPELISRAADAPQVVEPAVDEKQEPKQLSLF
jgi:DNA polymerase